MPIPTEELEEYARLLVKVGANVADGQIVAINAQPQHLDFVRLLTKVAYENGASYVDIWYFDPHSKLHRVQNAAEDTLGWTPPWLDRRAEMLVEEKAAAITLRGDDELGLLTSIDPTRVAKDRMPRLSSMLQLVSSEQVNWTIGPVPTKGWAKAAFGEPDVDRLWHELRKFFRLDTPDPVAAWKDHFETLEKRATTMNERAFDGLRYRGPGTDLFVGLIPGHIWHAARFTTRWGREHTPNLPTEEIFTSPHRERTEGTISSSMPLEAAGSVITDLRIRFERRSCRRVGRVARKRDRRRPTDCRRVRRHARRGGAGGRALTDRTERNDLLRNTPRRERDLTHGVRIRVPFVDPRWDRDDQGATRRRRGQQFHRPYRFHGRRY